MKKCSKCSEYKSVDSFADNKRYADGKFCYCRQCEAKRRREYVAKNPEKVRESNRMAKLNNPERVAKNIRDWRAKNSHHVAEYRRRSHYQNHAENLLKAQEWKKNNASKIRAYDSKRRVAEKKAVPSWANMRKIEEFYETADGLNMLTGEWHDVDHIVPLQSPLVCGLHCEANLQVLPRKENQSKGNRFWADMP
jgi:hypothetical protein